MENLDQQRVEKDAPITQLRVQLGELLARERLSQQKDEHDVARRLMLSKLQLLAIEAGESERFHHERRYIQGIKSYVFYLGLQGKGEVTTLVAQIENASSANLQASPAAGVAQFHRSSAAPAVKKSYASRGPRFVYYGLGVLVVGAIALAISEGWPFKEDDVLTASGEPITQAISVSERETSAASTSSTTQLTQQTTTQTAAQVASLSTSQGPSSVPASSATTPAPSPGPTPSPQPAATTPIVPVESAAKPASGAVSQPTQPTMRIDFNADCWVSLQTVEGKKEDRIYKAGETLSVPLANVSTLVLGNAPAAKVFFADRQVDIMSKGLTYGNVTRLDQKGIERLQKN